jgi:hypothetical protein
MGPALQQRSTFWLFHLCGSCRWIHDPSNLHCGSRNIAQIKQAKGATLHSAGLASAEPR